jgi:hypothetical protein
MGPTRREATIGHSAPFAAWVWRVSAGGDGLEKGDTMRRDAFVRHRTEAGAARASAPGPGRAVRATGARGHTGAAGHGVLNVPPS